MKAIHNYLFFDGNAREAMTFYKDCLGGDLQVMSYADAPGNHPPEAKDRVMHACLSNGSHILMASDMPPGATFKQGENFSISLSCDSQQEVDKLFGALGKNGKVTMALHDAFWGAYFGMLTDRFGVSWMFNFEKKPA